MVLCRIAVIGEVNMQDGCIDVMCYPWEVLSVWRRRLTPTSRTWSSSSRWILCRCWRRWCRAPRPASRRARTPAPTPPTSAAPCTCSPAARRSEHRDTRNIFETLVETGENYLKTGNKINMNIFKYICCVSINNILKLNKIQICFLRQNKFRLDNRQQKHHCVVSLQCHKPVDK